MEATGQTTVLNSGEIETYPDRTQAQAAGAINWGGYLNGNFYELLEMGGGLA